MVTFGRPFSTLQKEKLFPFYGYPMIAPYWANTDLQKRGDVFFRSASDSDTLNQVKDMINNGDDEEDYDEDDFSPLSLFITTWCKVPQYKAVPSEVSSLECFGT